jgi:hypothetical protein
VFRRMQDVDSSQRAGRCGAGPRRLSDLETQEKASRGRSQPAQRQALGVRFERDAFVAESAKRRAKGLSKLCRGGAPLDAKEKVAVCVMRPQASADW